MNNKLKNILKYFGGFLATISFVFMVIYRFIHPDITDIRWLIDFWYIELVGLLLSGIGLWIWYKNS